MSHAIFSIPVLFGNTIGYQILSAFTEVSSLSKTTPSILAFLSILLITDPSHPNKIPINYRLLSSLLSVLCMSLLE